MQVKFDEAEFLCHSALVVASGTDALQSNTAPNVPLEPYMIVGYFTALERCLTTVRNDILQRAARYLDVYGIEGLAQTFFEFAVDRFERVVRNAEVEYRAGILVHGTQDGFALRPDQLPSNTALQEGDEPPRQRQRYNPTTTGVP